MQNISQSNTIICKKEYYHKEVGLLQEYKFGLIF